MDARINLVKIREGIWLLEDAHDGTAYVVEGSERAMVIDTANGMQNFHDCVRELTDKPLARCIFRNLRARLNSSGKAMYLIWAAVRWK